MAGRDCGFARRSVAKRPTRHSAPLPHDISAMTSGPLPSPHRNSLLILDVPSLMPSKRDGGRSARTHHRTVSRRTTSLWPSSSAGIQYYLLPYFASRRHGRMIGSVRASCSRSQKRRRPTQHTSNQPLHKSADQGLPRRTPQNSEDFAKLESDSRARLDRCPALMLQIRYKRFLPVFARGTISGDPDLHVCPCLNLVMRRNRSFHFS